MRKFELLSVGEDLYEVVKRIPFSKFSKPIVGEATTFLREFYGSEKILKGNQTNEYIFVNLIPEAKIETENDKQRAKNGQSKKNGEADN
jgi:hypothetical protein